MDKKQYIAALLREKAKARNQHDERRVKAVEAELEKVGYSAKKPSERAEKRPSSPKSEKRKK